MRLTMRTYQTLDDYWMIRAFLREVFLLNQRREVSWTLARWDYWFWAGINVFEKDWFKPENIFLWETENGRLAAVLNPESRGDVFLQIHPDFCSPELIVEMVETAEKHLTDPGSGGESELRVWVIEAEEMLKQVLVKRGYSKLEDFEAMRRRSLDGELPKVTLPPGYSVRSLRWPDDLEKRSLASWRSFHLDTPVDPAYQDGDWMWFFQRVPLFREQLDLVVEAPDGEIASFCTVWYDDVTRTGYFEPVGTAPEHQRKGLGKAVMYEGLRRLKDLGGSLALVGSYSEGAGALYASAGFVEFERLEVWEM